MFVSVGGLRSSAAGSCAKGGAEPVRCRVRWGSRRALGLVVNAIVLWNTRYQDAALNQLRRGGFDVRDDDVKRLSPLGHEHINLLGRNQFSTTDLGSGQLRPLRDPTTPQA